MKEKITSSFGRADDPHGLKKCFIAGGAITSLYTNKPINDFDIYPKSLEGREDAIRWAFDSGYWNCHVSSRALTFANRDGDNVQIMLFDTFETADKIFSQFDFTVCMGAFDLDAEKFILHEKFLLHCSQRFLSFNPNTRYPYASAWRVRKYEEKGFTIGKMEYFKILMACQKSPINSWQDLKEQIGGVYGEAMVIPDDTEFSFEGAMESISTMRPSSDTTGYSSADEAIMAVSDREFMYFELEKKTFGSRYLVKIDDTWENMPAIPKNNKKVGIEAIFPEAVFYKKVQVSPEGILKSIHYPAFTYKVGEEVSSKTPYIYCFDNISAAEKYNGSTINSGKKTHVVLKLTCNHEDIVYDGSQPRLKRAFVEEIVEVK